MDITMCDSSICPLKSKCYRNPISGTKPSEFRQSWFMFDPSSDSYKLSGIETDECKYFMKKWGT